VTTINKTSRYLPFDYLKGFLIVLVVIHHSLLAYTTHGASTLILDNDKWLGIDVIVALSDLYFMSAFFLVSGLFVWRSLEKYGSYKFIVKRIIRLLLPFLLGFLVINIPAYYLSYLSFSNAAGLEVIGYINYWRYLISNGYSSIGPFWFIGMLFIFNIIVAIVYKIVPELGKTIKLKADSFFERKWFFIIVFFLMSLTVFLSLAIPFGSFSWTGFGPMIFQTSRILHYFVYFIMGTLVGMFGIERSIFKNEGPIAKRWWAWLIAGLVCYLLIYTIYLTTPLETDLLTTIFFTIVCMPLTFACIGFFIRFVKKENRVLKSLSENAYGIYIVHYSIVTLLQFLIYKVNLFAGWKALLVSVVGLSISWGMAWILRRMAFVRKII